MCRRTIEGFCFENGIKTSNLKTSLQKLVKQNVINEQLFEWADELRISGNEAAHKIDSTFSNIDAKDILDLTIAMLDYKYSFQTKFSDFKKRRSANQKAI